MTEMHGFKLIREQDIPEIKTTAKLFRHIKTGAELLSLSNDDENKVFGVAFRTVPQDSTGVPHILEHAVLGGSRKYPVKQPFLELVKGSLQTFVNAMTFSDKTVYPIASMNQQDFYNLADVYLDAVFHPNITPETLMREGWHYEMDDPKGELSFKGVVYNEMKGAYSAPENVLYRYAQQSLFPDTTYGVDSGGDPQDIPKLSYEQFREFYDTHYHPSNARIWFYGDDPLEERLKLVDSFLSEFEASQSDTSIALQHPLEKPIRMEIPYDAADAEGEEARALVMLNWLLPEPLDVAVLMRCSMMSRLLLSSSSAPLRKKLIDSGLGEDLIGGGLDPDKRQMSFSVGLRGVKLENVDKAEERILEALREIVEEGVDPAHIEATVNTYEFGVREQNTGSYPRGIYLFIAALTTWLYDGDPLAPLAFEAPLAAVKQEIADNPRFFEEMIEELLLDNRHRSTVCMLPDEAHAAKLAEAEKQRLAEVRQSLSAEDIEKIIQTTQDLHEMQQRPDSPEALATIPRLTLDDLEREVKTIPTEVEALQEATLLYHDLFSNGIAYIDVAFDVHSIPQDLLPYFGLFTELLVEAGTTTDDYVRLDQKIGQRTGGIRANTTITHSRFTQQDVVQMVLRGKATVDNVEPLLDLMHDVLVNVRLDDVERIRQILLEIKSSSEASLVPAGHMVAGGRLGAHFTVDAWLEEVLDGVEGLFFLRELLNRLDDDFADIQAKLATVRDLLLNRAAMTVNVTVDAAGMGQIRGLLEDFTSRFEAKAFTPQTWTPGFYPTNEGLSIPAQVNYVAKGANLFAHGYDYVGSSRVAYRQISLIYLWEKIRLQGGAYGAFVDFDAQSGNFSLISYRDPNLLPTIEVYDHVAEFVRSLQFDEAMLTQAIIGTISGMDSYQFPDAKGYTAMLRHMMGITDAHRQELRDQVLSTTLADIHAFADALAPLAEQGHVVALASRETLENANAAKGGDWLSITRIL